MLATGVSSGKIYRMRCGYADADVIAVWPYEDAVPDDDPNDNMGHGTHVSGIIAGETD